MYDHVSDTAVKNHTVRNPSCRSSHSVHSTSQNGVQANRPVFVVGKGKGKAVPLQAWGDPEGSRKLRFPDFMTTAQDGGKVVSLTYRLPLPTGNTPGTHLC